jgi:hypothetical protein
MNSKLKNLILLKIVYVFAKNGVTGIHGHMHGVCMQLFAGVFVRIHGIGSQVNRIVFIMPLQSIIANRTIKMM